MDTGGNSPQDSQLCSPLHSSYLLTLWCISITKRYRKAVSKNWKWFRQKQRLKSKGNWGKPEIKRKEEDPAMQIHPVSALKSSYRKMGSCKLNWYRLRTGEGQWVLSVHPSGSSSLASLHHAGHPGQPSPLISEGHGNGQAPSPQWPSLQTLHSAVHKKEIWPTLP